MNELNLACEKLKEILKVPEYVTQIENKLSYKYEHKNWKLKNNKLLLGK